MRLVRGDAIQFSNRKSVGKTPQRSQLTKEIEQASPGRASNLGTDLVAPDFSLPVVDPKEEKRQKQAAFEKKNWMLVNGQVDEDREVDEAFGIRSDEEFEKEGEQDSSWLSPLRDDRSRSQDSSSRGPAQTRAEAAQRFAPNRSSQGNESDSSSLSAGLGQERLLPPS
jgi:hypothetical protein